MQMDLNEMIQSANAGDVSAINRLGDYYLAEKDYAEALTWFSKAAEMGNVYGTLGAMNAARVVAIIYEDSDSEEMRRNLIAALGYCTALLSNADDSEAGSTARNMAIKAYPSIVFGIASSLYDDGNIESARKMLQEQEEPEAKVLLGLCYMKIGSGDAGERVRAFEAAYPLLSIVETDDVSNLPVRYQHTALLSLSSLYRLAGEFGTRSVPTDVEHAYQCVLKASNLPDLPDAVRNFTNAELSKYRKKFFGGYCYNG